MGLTNPKNTVGKFVTMPRWQRNWIDDHRSINFSGLVQELMIEIIRNHDPEYFDQNKQHLEIHLSKKKEIIDHIVKTKPILIP